MDKNNYLLFVVHIQQENDIIRIISARQATRQERNYYENLYLETQTKQKSPYEKRYSLYA
jgi:hypothetical protein